MSSVQGTAALLNYAHPRRARLLQKQLPVTNEAIQGVRGLMGPNLMTSKVSFILRHGDSMLWEWFHSGWQVRTCLFPLMAISRVG